MRARKTTASRLPKVATARSRNTMLSDTRGKTHIGPILNPIKQASAGAVHAHVRGRSKVLARAPAVPK